LRLHHAAWTSFCSSSADAIDKERSSSDFQHGTLARRQLRNDDQMRVTRRASVASRSIVGPSRPRSGWPRSLSLVPRQAGTRARGSGSNPVRLRMKACSDWHAAPARGCGLGHARRRVLNQKPRPRVLDQTQALLSFKPDPILSGFLTTTHCGASMRRLPARDPAWEASCRLDRAGMREVRCAASASALT
jgi:hypothetical protein